MSVELTAHSGKKGAATGISALWQDGQLVMLVAPRGLVSCGIISLEVSEKFGFAAAIAHGTPEKPLVTAQDLLEAKVSEVTRKARELGVEPGMSGQQAFDLLSG